MVVRKTAAAGAAARVGRLHRDDWARAALLAMRDGGLAAIVVEQLAARLHTTKGSFYWHFKDRDALIRAALDYWEQHMTQAVVDKLETAADPHVRLRMLFDISFDDQFGGSMIVALLSDADDARIAPILQQVTRRRLAYLAETLVACGVPLDRAEHHALLASAAYVGYFGMRAAVPDEPAFGTGAALYREHMWRVLTAEVPGVPVDPAYADGSATH